MQDDARHEDRGSAANAQVSESAPQPDGRGEALTPVRLLVASINGEDYLRVADLAAWFEANLDHAYATAEQRRADDERSIGRPVLGYDAGATIVIDTLTMLRDLMRDGVPAWPTPVERTPPEVRGHTPAPYRGQPVRRMP